jgi:proline iminopeptidase
MSTQSIRRELYKYSEPYLKGNLKVSNIHTIYWEVSGNAEGLPAVILHGGPGGGSAAFYRGYFDPEVYKIVQLDQRGSG